MKKTLRKAVAVLLAVLMVVCSVPFTALATNDMAARDPETGKPIGWWGDSNYMGISNDKIPDGEQDYIGWQNIDDLGFNIKTSFVPTSEMEYVIEENLAADYGFSGTTVDEGMNWIMGQYKPVLTVTVSNQGKTPYDENGNRIETSGKAASGAVYQQYYGFSTDYTLSTVQEAGNILNPAKLEKGQRIAVTFELGGMDTLRVGQLKFIYPTRYLQAAYYTRTPGTSNDRWSLIDASDSNNADLPFITQGYSYYPNATKTDVINNRTNLIAEDGGGDNYPITNTYGETVKSGEYGQVMVAYGSTQTTTTKSTYIGKNVTERGYGDNGNIICTISFEVMEDCDLSKVLDFKHDLGKNTTPIDTTFFAPFEKETEMGQSRYLFCFDNENEGSINVCWGLMALNFTNYTASSTPTECTHANAEHHDAVPATCKDTGMIEYWYCPDCKKYFSDAEFKTEITVNDTTDGRVTDKDPTSHTSISKVDGSAATCMAKGTKDSYKCAGCGNVYTEATAIYADDGETITGWTVTESSKITSDADLDIPIVDTAHKWGAWTEAGTDAETGNYIHTRTCELNANHTETADCTWGELITDKAATEKTKGAGHYVCTECGQVKSVVLDELPCDHAAAQKVTKVDAKCDSIGREAYWTCPTCGKNFTDSTCTVQVTDLTTLDIPAINHANAQLVEATPATCTSKGIVAHYHCPDCGLDFTDATCTTELADTTAPIVDTAHSWSDWSPAGKNAEGTYIHTRTCANDTTHTETANCTFGELQVVDPASETTEGKGYYECTVCGQTYDYVIPVKDCAHASMEPHARVEATCAKEGNIAYWYCPTCDKYFSDAEGNVEITQAQTVIAIVADAHSWSDWSSNNDGTHSRTCSNEGCPVGTQTENCKMKVTSEQVDPTCEGYGTTAIETCEVCTYQTGGTSINPIEHSWLDWAADEGADTHTRVCANDANHTQTENHNWVETSAQVNPTCTEAGKTAVYTCSVCQAVKGGETINATEHSWGAWTAVEGTDTHTRTCSNANCPIGTQTEAHNWVETAAEVPATFDAAGTTAAYACSDCSATKGGEPIAQLESWTIAVEASEYGTSTLNDKDSSAGLSMKVGKDTTVTLTAAPVEGCQFVGWKLGNKIVSDQATYSFTAIANATYTPVYTESINNTFTVVFADAYGNVIATINATDTDDLVTQAEAITAPAMPGKTFTGWSEDLSTISAGMTVYAQYSADASALYTVTATGCTITDDKGNTADNVMENVPYNTKVTVAAKDGAASCWRIDDATGKVLSYDAEYSFFVGADITVVPEITGDVVTAKPTVTAVKTSSTTDSNGYVRAVFLASRSMAGSYTYVSSGIIYGVNGNVTAATTLNDVDGKTVRRFETSTSSEQFSLTVGAKSQSGTISAVAYITYADAAGKTYTDYAAFADFAY